VSTLVSCHPRDRFRLMASLTSLPATAALCLFATTLHAQTSDGYITTSDSVRLYYQKVGSGARTIIVPGRLFLWETARQLGDQYTVIAYDMRNRGRSSRVDDATKITIEADVRDVDEVRRHFQVARADLIGYSYLGMMVMLYTREHPQQVNRVVQLGPVPLRWDSEFPASLRDTTKPRPDSASLRRLDALKRAATPDQKALCEANWAVSRFGLVGDPSHVDRLGGSRCDMPNEWPVNFDRHLAAQFPSVQKLRLSWSDFSHVSNPVLTIHGTRDRNATYAAGREWALRLPNARLITIERGAHQAFSEYPEIVLPAIRTFLAGSWPASAERVQRLERQ
jgi:pimeloyl-ACP methyl ester carboxylesterase